MDGAAQAVNARASALSLIAIPKSADQAALLVEELGAKGHAATFFVPSELVVESVGFWRQVVSAGHELGNGTITAAAADSGAMPLWTFEMIRAELASWEQLSQELGIQVPRAVLLPSSRSRRCADGDYRDSIPPERTILEPGPGLNLPEPAPRQVTYLPRHAGVDRVLQAVAMALAGGLHAIIELPSKPRTTLLELQQFGGAIAQPLGKALDGFGLAARGRALLQ